MIEGDPVNGTYYPAHSEHVIEVRAEDDLLLYHFERNRAYCLNPRAAALWHRCDGTTSIDEILQSGGEEDFQALLQLHADGLLKGMPPADKSDRVSRRAFVRAGSAVAVGATMLPLIQSLAIPPIAAAASGYPSNQYGNPEVGSGDPSYSSTNGAPGDTDGNGAPGNTDGNAGHNSGVQNGAGADDPASDPPRGKQSGNPGSGGPNSGNHSGGPYDGSGTPNGSSSGTYDPGSNDPPGNSNGQLGAHGTPSGPGNGSGTTGNHSGNGNGSGKTGNRDGSGTPGSSNGKGNSGNSPGSWNSARPNPGGSPPGNPTTGNGPTGMQAGSTTNTSSSGRHKRKRNGYEEFLYRLLRLDS